MRTTLLLLALFTLSCDATAAVVLYDEAQDGDLAPAPSLIPDLGESLSQFVLQSGDNRIFGDMNLRAISSIPFDVDAFSVIVPDGLSLHSISIETTRSTGGADSLSMAVSTGSQFNNSNIDEFPLPPILGILATPIPGVTTNSNNPSIFPLGPGTYAVSFDQAVISGSIEEMNPFQWTASLNAVPIPEPSAITCLLCLCTMASVCWRSST